MGHGSRLCFRSGLAGVARARCRVECGALRSFINGKLLQMSDFAGGGIMADILTEQVVASFFTVNLGLAIACLVRGRSATKPLIACALPIVCIVLPYAALVANPFLRCALDNVHVVDYAEALARAISADDNRFGHCPGRKWPNGIAF